MAILSVVGYELDEVGRLSVAGVAQWVVLVGGYVVLWFFWQGRNWARWLVLFTSLVALFNLTLLGLAFVRGVATTFLQIVVVIEAAFGAFLLYWLNTAPVKAFFRGSTRGAEP
jgi:hypothetical protein